MKIRVVIKENSLFSLVYNFNACALVLLIVKFLKWLLVLLFLLPLLFTIRSKHKINNSFCKEMMDGISLLVYVFRTLCCCHFCALKSCKMSTQVACDFARSSVNAFFRRLFVFFLML